MLVITKLHEPKIKHNINFVVFTGALNDKMHVLKTLNREQDNDQSHQDEQLDPGKISSFGKLYSAILLSPGDVVSLTKLTAKGLFRPAVDGISGRQLMLKVTVMYS